MKLDLSIPNILRCRSCFNVFKHKLNKDDPTQRWDCIITHLNEHMLSPRCLWHELKARTEQLCKEPKLHKKYGLLRLDNALNDVDNYDPNIEQNMQPHIERDYISTWLNSIGIEHVFESENGVEKLFLKRECKNVQRSEASHRKLYEIGKSLDMDEYDVQTEYN